MAQQQKAKKKQSSQQEQQQRLAAQKAKQGQLRKTFTIIICVLVALSLMLPVAGIGAASCSGGTDTQQATDTAPIEYSSPVSQSND